MIFLFSDEYFRDYCGASTRSTIRHSSAKLVRTNYQWYQIRSSWTSLFATQKRPLYHKCQIGNCYFPLIFVQVKNYFSVGNFAWLFLKTNRNFLPTYKPSYKVLSHNKKKKKNGTLLSVIYVILLIILIVKDVNNQTSSIFCNSNLSSKNQKKNCESPLKKKFSPLRTKKLSSRQSSPPTFLWYIISLNAYKEYSLPYESYFAY